LLRDTDELHAERISAIVEAIQILPGVEWAHIQNRIEIRWYANEHFPHWGKVFLCIDLNAPISLAWVTQERQRRNVPPLTWDHWKYFGFQRKKVTKIQPIRDQLGALYLKQAAGSDERWLTDIAYGRILGDLWADGHYRGKEK
jgi:hypothetical protein